MTLLLAIAFISIISVLTLRKTRGYFSLTNLLGTYMFSYIMIGFTGIIINLNLALTDTPKKEIVFWTQKIPELTVKPVLVSWLVVLLFLRINVYLKVLAVCIFLTALVSTELFFVNIHYLKFVHWNAFYSYLRYIIVVSAAILYALLLKKFIEKRNRYGTLSS